MNPAARPHPRLVLVLAALSLAFAVAPAAAQSPTLLQLRSVSSEERMRVDSTGALVASGQWRLSAPIPAAGAGSRLMWVPGRGAFRAGTVTGTEWDASNTGYYSVALGYNVVASQSHSVAFGEGAQATGYTSFAAGRSTAATNTVSTAFGEESVASGYGSFAAGATATASGLFAVAIGTLTNASGNWSVALGRRTSATADRATALGDSTAASGERSTAMGFNASTNGMPGAFVYGDATTTTRLFAQASNQFSVRAAGGFRFFTNAGLSAGVTLAAGGGSWTTVSDRARKQDFLAVDGEDVLRRIQTLPVSTWRYIAEEDRGVRHIGPMAQDWARAFGFSSDSLTINTGDFDGVNLAAVQALEARTRAQAERLRAVEEENARLRAENTGLRTVLDDVQERLRRVEQRVEGERPRDPR